MAEQAGNSHSFEVGFATGLIPVVEAGVSAYPSRREALRPPPSVLAFAYTGTGGYVSPIRPALSLSVLAGHPQLRLSPPPRLLGIMPPLAYRCIRVPVASCARRCAYGAGQSLRAGLASVHAGAGARGSPIEKFPSSYMKILFFSTIDPSPTAGLSLASGFPLVGFFPPGVGLPPPLPGWLCQPPLPWPWPQPCVRLSSVGAAQDHSDGTCLAALAACVRAAEVEGISC